MVGISDTNDSDGEILAYLDEWMTTNKMLRLARQKRQRSRIQEAILRVWRRWDVDLTLHGIHSITNYALPAKNQTLAQATILAIGDFCNEFDKNEFINCWDQLWIERSGKLDRYPERDADLVYLSAEDIKQGQRNLRDLKAARNGRLPPVTAPSAARLNFSRAIPFSVKPFFQDTTLGGISGATAIRGSDANAPVPAAPVPAAVDVESNDGSEGEDLHVLEVELQDLKNRLDDMQNNVGTDRTRFDIGTIDTINDLIYSIFALADDHWPGNTMEQRLEIIRECLDIPGARLDITVNPPRPGFKPQMNVVLQP